jgi:hypothetical protein
MKNYQVQVKFNKNDWTTVKDFPTQKYAMEYIHDNVQEDSKYPMRIVRVVKTVVFEGK